MFPYRPGNIWPYRPGNRLLAYTSKTQLTGDGGNQIDMIYTSKATEGITAQLARCSIDNCNNFTTTVDGGFCNHHDFWRDSNNNDRRERS